MSVSHGTAQDLVRNLLELQSATRRVLKASAAHRELSVVQTTILTLLSCTPGRRAKDIVAESALGASGMSRHLAVLEQLGHVARTPDPADGRAQIVHLTASGRTALESHLRADAESLASRLGDLSEEDAARTSDSLSRLTELFLASLGTAPRTATIPAVPTGAAASHDPVASHDTTDPLHPGASGTAGRGEENTQ
ncbi:MarR family transcriptional regulator [Kocuria tytonicola]|uniref:MarR family transcriptional regulator n=1 Tax=Kocuria tytonicola TaxID=2055946 RepID=A0A3L9L7E3_9MICC|nr:MarR family winged helix-turn-helix transcriptional regulator [Kocuria tytonicola]RLY94896.1 MarR family transcriptional regulator [Kocuria tytonicola]